MVKQQFSKLWSGVRFTLPAHTIMKGFEQPSHEERKRKETPSRFLKGVEIHVGTSIGKIEVFGRENIDEIPPNSKVIIVVTHISDLDLPLAIKTLGHDFDIVVTAQSTNFNFLEDPIGYTATKLAGMNNFLPVDYAKTEGGKSAEFNPDNFIAMKEALDKGKDIVIAAHNPTKNGKLGRGSVGPVYLAQISGATILPVSVNLKTKEVLGIDDENKIKTMLKRPDAEVHIGKPIASDQIKSDEIKRIMDKRKHGEKITPEERSQFNSAISSLREKSDVVMHELAEMLPESKQGEYRE